MRQQALVPPLVNGSCLVLGCFAPCLFSKLTAPRLFRHVVPVHSHAQAWVKQYKLDLRAACDVFAKSCGKQRSQQRISVTTDEFLDYLTALDPAKAASLSQEQVTSMYRQALRVAGPVPTEPLAMVFAATVLDNGFVGPAAHLQSVSLPQATKISLLYPTLQATSHNAY